MRKVKEGGGRRRSGARGAAPALFFKMRFYLVSGPRWGLSLVFLDSSRRDLPADEVSAGQGSVQSGFEIRKNCAFSNIFSGIVLFQKIVLFLYSYPGTGGGLQGLSPWRSLNLDTYREVGTKERTIQEKPRNGLGFNCPFFGANLRVNVKNQGVPKGASPGRSFIWVGV